VSSLYQRNLAHVGARDIILAGYGGAGQSIVAAVVRQLGLDYIDPYTERLVEDGTSTEVEGHREFRDRLSLPQGSDGTGAMRFFKTHLPPHVFDGRGAGGSWLVVRDPRDSLYSWYRWRVAFGEEEWDTFDGSFESFLRHRDATGRTPVEDWTYFHDHWLRRPPRRDRFIVTRFEDLKTDPTATCSEALRTIGLPMPQDRLREAVEASSFTAMRAREDAAAGSGERVMRRGKVGEWREWLTPRLGRHFQDEQLWRVAGRFGYAPA
jgi:hypothetical protein